jgi:hypothetical protein
VALNINTMGSDCPCGEGIEQLVEQGEGCKGSEKNP